MVVSSSSAQVVTRKDHCLQCKRKEFHPEINTAPSKGKRHRNGQVTAKGKVGKDKEFINIADQERDGHGKYLCCTSTEKAIQRYEILINIYFTVYFIYFWT